MQMIGMIALLIIIQALRAGFVMLLQAVYEPAVAYNDFIFIIIGAILYFLFRPDRNSLGLDLSNKSRRSKTLYIIAAAVITLLFVLPLVCFSDHDLEGVSMAIKVVLLFPIFEELLFRGFLWDKIKKSGKKDYQVFLITTLLFGLWHLGYWDIIYYNSSQHFTDTNMNYVMINKALIGVVYGAATGLTRIKTKNTYSCIMLHSLLNIFGR